MCHPLQALTLLSPVEFLLYQLELHALQGEAKAEDDVVCAGYPDGSVGLEDAPRLPEPPDVEPMIGFEAHGPVPGALVDRGEASVPDRHAAFREPVRRVCEDHVHALWRHGLHEVYAVGEVDHRPRLAERLEVPEFHVLF
jgi:hypothetical protein